MNGNVLMTLMLRTPLHVFLGDTMLISLRGRRTGRKLVIPVNYFYDVDAYWVMSARSRVWWRNLQGGAPVELHLHGRDVKGFGQAILDEKEVVGRLGGYLKHFPMAAASLKVRMENGVANPQDARRLARERLFVKICPTKS